MISLLSVSLHHFSSFPLSIPPFLLTSLHLPVFLSLSLSLSLFLSFSLSLSLSLSHTQTTQVRIILTEVKRELSRPCNSYPCGRQWLCTLHISCSNAREGFSHFATRLPTLTLTHSLTHLIFLQCPDTYKFIKQIRDDTSKPLSRETHFFLFQWNRNIAHSSQQLL